MEVPWEFFRWTLAGRCGQMFGWRLEMDPGLGIGRGNWFDFFEWTPAGKSGRSFGQKFWTPPPRWSNRMDFWSENLKVNCSVK